MGTRLELAYCFFIVRPMRENIVPDGEEQEETDTCEDEDDVR